MPRARIQDIRRQELIVATIDAIHRYGYSELTVAQISAEAGLSAGNIHYYFGGKQELLFATMRWLLSQLQATTREKIAQSKTPRERIEALIDSNFAPELYTPAIISAWIHFWAQAPHHPELKRLQQVNANRVRNNLLHAFKQCLPPEQARQGAITIQALMDGIWIQAAQEPANWQPEAARQLARACLDQLLPTHYIAQPRNFRDNE